MSSRASLGAAGTGSIAPRFPGIGFSNVLLKRALRASRAIEQSEGIAV